MRHLNKIIFINSANIPFAEIRLDGNVHLEGTQGVGKSTVLRALLFFYNADKLHLGIQPGQKPFEDFYFRYSNSFIVYEVASDQAAYSIITMRSQGKMVYRFVDAAFSKEWFFGEGNKAESDWIRIRDRISSKGISISNKIDTYEMYRNIIFGNTHDRSHRYDRYALVESSNYQNIPRSIQNVFLNSKLDADFVKRTIIQSMADIEDSIELAPYRKLVSNFEREFDEINCWFEKDKSGNVPVRIKANQVVNHYRLLLALGNEAVHLWHELNHAVAYSREQLPLITDGIEATKQKLRIIKEKRDAESEEYQKAHDKLVSEIAIFDGKIKEIRTKRAYYEQIHIAQLIEQDNLRPSLEAEREQKQHTLRALEAQYNSVTDKYRMLYQALDNELKAAIVAMQEELQRQKDRKFGELEKIQTERDKQKGVLGNAHKEWLQASDVRLESLQEEMSRARLRLNELNYWHPLEKEMSALAEEQAKLDLQEKDLNARLTILKADMDATRREGQARQEQLQASYNGKTNECRKKIDSAKDDLQLTEQTLSRWQGSLYEWLSKNKPGWEENIGKVVDEQLVLYADNLNPQLADESASLFGINVNLDALPHHHHSPDDYRRLQQEQQETLRSLQAQLAQLQKEADDESNKLKASYNRKLSEKKQEELQLNMQLQQLPTKRKNLDTRLRMLRQKEEEQILAEQQRRTDLFNNATIRVEKEKDARKAELNKYERDIKTADRTFEQKRKQQEKVLADAANLLKAKEEEKRKEINSRHKDLQLKEHDELQGLGADTTAIEQCRNAIEATNNKLKVIEEQHHYVIEYRKDENELFSHENEFKEERRKLQARQEQESTRFQDRQRKHEEEQQEQQKKLSTQIQQRTQLEEGLRQYESMRQTEGIVNEALLDDDRTEHTSTSCTELVTAFRAKMNKQQATKEQLKRDANAFNAYFLANNTFHFPPLEKDDDYLPYALNLQEFLDNNKIEDARRLTSEHYSTILRSISREIGMLMSHKAEIQRVINDINTDFQQRGGFSGVIRSIELKIEESSDKMMRLMLQIRDFTEENSLSIGEANLFSGDDRDHVNMKVVDYLKRFMRQLQNEPARSQLTLSDTFRLQFRVKENDNDTRWVERINNVGSDGTDVLVKAMVNIMLINVFKTRASRKNGDFIIHCMMDEIGKLHPSNVKGILQFANMRNIYLINCSPMGFNGDLYKYNYILKKDAKAQTIVKRLISNNNL